MNDLERPVSGEEQDSDEEKLDASLRPDVFPISSDRKR